MLKFAKKLKYLALIAAMLILMAADDDTIVQRADISQGHIVGINVDYYVKIPEEWQGTVYVERQTQSERLETERLSFYCLSKSGRFKAEPMFNIYIIAEGKWNEEYTIVKRNGFYIIAVEYFDGSGFDYAPDIEQFNEEMSYAGTVEKLKNLILLSGEGKKVYVRSVATSSPPETVDGLYYIPLREAAEALGYTVNWWQKDSTVVIDRKAPKQFRDSFKMTTETTENSGCKMRLINNRTYVHTAYFVSVLKANIEIGEDGNVYISEL